MLSFEYDSRRNASVATYRGFTIEAEQDSDAGNPWEEWDCQHPLLVDQGRDGLTEHGAFPDPFAGTSDAWINRNWKAIAKALDGDASEAEERKRDDGYSKIADARRDVAEEWLEAVKPSRYSGNASDYMEAMAALCELRGWPALSTSTRGYSQGDYAALLLVYTPEHAKACGVAMPRTKKARAAILDSLASDAKLYGAWAWGDVYGYVIKDESGETLDSCWGFYGSDFANSGLSGAAEESLGHIVKERRKARQTRLASLIRARVPLPARAAILEGFPL